MPLSFLTRNVMQYCVSTAQTTTQHDRLDRTVCLYNSEHCRKRVYQVCALFRSVHNAATFKRPLPSTTPSTAAPLLGLPRMTRRGPIGLLGAGLPGAAPHAQRVRQGRSGPKFSLRRPLLQLIDQRVLRIPLVSQSEVSQDSAVRRQYVAFMKEHAV